MNTPYSTIAEKVGHADVYGSLLLLGPRTRTLRSRLDVLKKRQSYEEYASSSNNSYDLRDPLVAVSHVHDEMTIVRFLANDLDDAYQLLAEMLYPTDDHSIMNRDQGLVDARIFENRLHGGMVASDLASNHSSAIRALRAYDHQNTKI